MQLHNKSDRKEGEMWNNNHSSTNELHVI